MNKYKFFLLIVSMLFFSNCKKDPETSIPTNPNPNNDSLIFGLWEIKLFTMVSFDSIGNISDIDTIEYVNSSGDPVTLLEEYKVNNKFYAYSDTIIDTVFSSTFSISNNVILINSPDSILNFNNRTIAQLDSFNMELYQNYNSTNPKYKLIQKYNRR